MIIIIIIIVVVVVVPLRGALMNRLCMIRDEKIRFRDIDGMCLSWLVVQA